MHFSATWLAGPGRLSTRFGEKPRFREGLYQLRRTSYAWMVPNGSWGETNLGLVDCGKESVLIDTAWDLNYTRELLCFAQDILARAPIGAVVNTHSDGDHCWGNQLFADKPIVATHRCIAQLDHVTPAAMRLLKSSARAMRMVPGREATRFGRYVESMVGPYDFSQIKLTRPNEGFTKERVFNFHGRSLVLREVGPAHTDGDAYVYVPDDRVVYTGDLLFVGTTPVMWAGPTENLLSGLRSLKDLDADLFVPGHGPLATRRDVQVAMDYWEFAHEALHRCFLSGMLPHDAAKSVLCSAAFRGQPFARWDLPERLVTSATAMYRNWGFRHSRLPANIAALDLLRRQARVAAEAGYHAGRERSDVETQERPSSDVSSELS